MTPESFGSNFEHQEQLKLKIASPEDIKKVEQSIEYSKKLVRANDVLKVLDFPDNQEESYRQLLLKQDNNTLESLATKSKDEILLFFVQEKKRNIASQKLTVESIEIKEAQKQTYEIEKQTIKAEKIK